MSLGKLFNLIEKGGSGSGNFGHGGIPGHLGGSTPSGSGGGSAEPIKISENRETILKEALDGSLKGKFKIGSGSSLTYKDEQKGLEYRVSSQTIQDVVGKYVAGTASQQRYNLRLSLTIKDSFGGKIYHPIAESAKWKGTDSFQIKQDKEAKAKKSMNAKTKTLFGAEIY